MLPGHSSGEEWCIQKRRGELNEKNSIMNHTHDTLL